MRLMQVSHKSQGFTLVEIMVAMTVLLVGMAGVIALFTTGLTLERRSTLAIDTAVSLRDIEPIVRADVTKRLAQGEEIEDINVPRSPIPGWVGLDYKAEILPLPGHKTNEGYLMKVTVMPIGVPEDKGQTYGYLPVRLGRTFESLVKDASRETLEVKK